MNERTNPLSFPLPVSLALSLGLRSRRSGSKNRPFASRPSRRTEPATFPSSRTSFHPRVPATRFLARAYSRLRAYVCARTIRVYLASVACAYRRRTTHTRNLASGGVRGGILLSFSLYASRTAVPVSRNQRLRSLLIDLILSRLSLSFFLFSSLLVVPSSSRRPRLVDDARCRSARLPVRHDGNARRTANQPPTNRPNRPTALHYPPSTTGAQPLSCTDAATAAGVRRHPRAYPPSLSFPRLLFSSPSLTFSISILLVRAVEHGPATPYAYAYIHLRLREPVITPPFAGV